LQLAQGGLPGKGVIDALIVAMKKEKVAFKMYSDMAASVGDPKLRETLLGLANEEAKHKLRFELEYDDEVLNQHSIDLVHSQGEKGKQLPAVREQQLQ